MPLALVVSLLLAAPRTAPPLARWSTDGRSFLLTTKDMGPATVEETTIVDLWTGEREVIERLTSTCDFHGDVDEQLEVQTCRKTQARGKAAYQKRMAALLTRKSAPAQARTGLPVQVTAALLTSNPPGRPSHHVPVVDAAADRVHLYASTDGQWAVATVDPREGGHHTALVMLPLVARLEVVAAREGVASELTAKLTAAGYAPVRTVNSTKPVGAPAICFLPGFEAEAAQVAQALALPAEAVSRCVEPTASGLTLFAGARP
jgi:hypothetical protein